LSSVSAQPSRRSLAEATDVGSTGAFAAARLRGHDGTELTYYTAGDPGGPAMVMCGGLGGGATIWRPFLARFAERYRLVTWDYRGLYDSGPAHAPTAYDMSRHVRDLLDVLEKEEIESPLLVGWSMGVQLALELHRTHPRAAAGFVAIHGTCGRPLATAFDSATAEMLAPLAFAVMRGVGDRFGLVGPSLARTPLVVRSLVWATQRMGWMAGTVDMEAFRDIAEEWSRRDLRVYAEIFEQLGRHDASDLLPSIETPTLVIAGDRDRFTPAHLATRMVEEMPCAQLEVVKGATHFGLLEYPDAMIRCVEGFLRELGW
jgi:pimeloyl-ACP methyl ester carboxylesterase